MLKSKLHRGLILIEKCWICGYSTPIGVEHTKNETSDNINLLRRYKE
jgi:hypothetical protein